MARWTNLDEAEIRRLSSKNRASHVKVEDRRNGAQGAVEAATERSGAIGREFDGVAVSKRLAKIKPKRAYVPKLTETSVMQTCYELMLSHPGVALVWRQNTGMARIGERYVKFSFRGASDLMGILHGGRFIAVETKATGKKPSADQQGFLDNVNGAGGLGVCVDDTRLLQSILDGLTNA